MKRQRCTLGPAVIFFLAVLACAGAADRPDFSGKWVFNAARSKLQIPVPQSSTFLIEHREPAFHLSRTHVYDGKGDTFAIDLSSDGRERVIREGPQVLHCRLYWEGTRLVFHTRIEMDGKEALNVVQYELSADGLTFTAHESFRGPKLKYDNVWVFDRAQPEVRAVPVSEKVFMLDGLAGAGNVAFLVTGEGVLVVDGGASPADGRVICEKVREKTDKPIRLVALTHYHGDHIFGLQSFPADALVIAQQNMPKNILGYTERIQSERQQLPARIAALEAALGKLGRGKKVLRQKEEEDLARAREQYAFYQQLRIVQPHLTFDKKLSFRFGGEPVEIIHLGPAHTDDSSLVYFPGQKVIHMGDMLFNRHHPYIDRRAGSNTANWIAALQEAQNWPLEKVIPGHGPLAGKEALAEQARYLTDLRAAVSAAMQKGLTLEQAKKEVTLPAWLDLGFPGVLPMAVEAVYRELERE